MKILRRQLQLTYHFLKQSHHSFRDVLVVHGLMLFIVIPGLTATVKFLLASGDITYLALDQFFWLLTHHPFVVASLIGVGILILLAVFFEFTFLLFSMYFIQKKQRIRLTQLLRLSIQQMKKIRVSVLVFFLLYFVLLLPIGTFNFRSDLLAKIQIPAFIMDYIFANRVSVIASFVVGYLVLLYLGIRFLFVLPELIFNNKKVGEAIEISWTLTKKRLFFIFFTFLGITLSILAINALAFILLIFIQNLFDSYLPKYALIAAVFIMFFMQAALLLNVVLTTISSFYFIIFILDQEQRLPEQLIPLPSHIAATFSTWQMIGLALVGSLFGVSVGLYNYDYLNHAQLSVPLTISHRGVSNGNGIQNTLASLAKTSTTYHPNYVEMDVQETSDHQFIVYHDFSYRNLAKTSLVPEENTLEQALSLQLKENGQVGNIASFDAYLKEAKRLNQKLLIEIKTQQKDKKGLAERFLAKYKTEIDDQHHLVQSLNYQIVETIKTQAPEITVGYILPFNLVGPPKTQADFLVMEMTTLTSQFVTSAHQDDKKVFVWTPNDIGQMERMMFYGVDGIITDRMDLLNEAKKIETTEESYADKLAYFVVGIG